MALLTSDATTNGGARGAAKGPAPGTTSEGPEEPSELIPHPVFARKEKTAKGMEASAATAAAVVDMVRAAEAFAERMAACEGRLAAATAKATGSATVNTLCTGT